MNDDVEIVQSGTLHVIKINTCQSIASMLGQMIAASQPENLNFILVQFDPSDPTEDIRALSFDGEVEPTVKVLRHFADRLEASKNKIDEGKAANPDSPVVRIYDEEAHGEERGTEH